MILASKEPNMKLQRILLPLLAVTAMAFTGVATAHGAGDTVKPNFSREIPNIPGKSLIAVEVLYPPGGASLPHSHAKSSFIYAYVVSGSIASKVNDEPERVYKAGESFFEEPGSRLKRVPLEVASTRASSTLELAPCEH